MSIPLDPSATTTPAMEVHLLGALDFDAHERLQQRLVYEAGGRADGQITLLICEYRPIITVGRAGSYDHLRLEPGELEARQMELRWVGRGGGCMIHGPGQVVVNLIVPLDVLGWTVGEYLDRLQAGLVSTLQSLGIKSHTRGAAHGIWGRVGQLAALGVAVKHGTAYHGAYINVAPKMDLYQYVDTDPLANSPMSCLLAQRGQPIKMTSVRAALASHLAEALDCPRYHLHTGHPLLAETRRDRHLEGSNKRAS
ncbi:MAG: hypothetical protein IID44_07845 [Planctomycetes bacterium]|nr:hypothetical protein [Planctomycetota bacterium]